MFDRVTARIAGRFGRVEPRRTARAYLLGLLSGVERKNCWQLAEQAGHARPGPMFLAYATRRGRALTDRRLYLPEHSWCTDPERRRAAGIPDEGTSPPSPAWPVR